MTASRVPVRHWVLFWALALGGAAVDLASKAVVFNRVGEPPAPPVSVLGNVVELRTSYNPGALWGIGRNLPQSGLIFAALSGIAAVAILYVLFVRGWALSPMLTIALGLIMAGALGNCYDRVVLGHVRDFIHVHVDAIGFDFPIFNLADSMLVVGASIVMLRALRPDPLDEFESPEVDDARAVSSETGRSVASD